MAVIRSKYEQTKVKDVPLFLKPTSTQEVLSIKAIDETGIFALNDKKYSKLYALSDINFSGVTDTEQKNIIIEYSKVLKTIPCRFSFTVANEYVDEESFKRRIFYPIYGNELDELSQAMNEVIEDSLVSLRQGLYQTIYLTLTVKAENMVDAKDSFKSMESAIRSAFMGIGGAGSVMRVVGINERMQLLFNFTHAGIENEYKFDFNREIENKHDFSNILAPATFVFENDFFIMNGMYGKVLAIEDYPKSLESDIISSLSKINCTSYIAVNSELIDIAGFKTEIGKKYMAVGMKIENEKQRNRNNNDFLSDASSKLLSEKEKLDQFSREIDELDDHYFNTTILILVLAKDREELSVIEEKVNNVASLKSLKLKSCFGKQKEGINSALPLGVQEYKHQVNLSSTCLSMFMPYKTQELNDMGGIYYGTNQLSGNAIVADKKKLKNHNGMILGQSGSGKSVFGKSEIISVFVTNPSDQILIIDPQSEYRGLAKVTGGTVISFDSAKEFYLNPLDVDFTGIDYGRLREIISEKSDFILSLLGTCMKKELSPEEEGIIDSVVEKVYSENFSLRKRLNGEVDKESVYKVPGFLKQDISSMLTSENLSRDEQVKAYSPTLQDIYQGLMDVGTDVSTHLAASMDIFVNGSLNLFNHRTNVDLSNRFIVFDISGMKENLRIISMLVMMETVREKIKENSVAGRWTHLYIDEFHELLSVSQIAGFILKLWKEIRKLKGIVNGITQNMSDLLDNDDGGKLSAILSNTEYFALLSQSSTDKLKLMKFLPQISPAMFNFVDGAESGTGLIKMGPVTVPFDMRMSKDSKIYNIVNTDGGSYGV